jgi:hypothetical protein
MTDAARRVQRTYLLLTLLSTLSASFIWGINTLFLPTRDSATGRPSRRTPSSRPEW